MPPQKNTVTVDTPGPYHFGDTVNVSTDVPADERPWIEMSCTQDGEVVGTASHAGFPGGSYYGQPFQLGPSLVWDKGGAVCTFTVVHIKTKGNVVTDASTTIDVQA